MLYFSTFITGFDQLVLNQLKQDLADFKLVTAHPGLVIFETNIDSERLKTIGYLNTLLQLLSLPLQLDDLQLLEKIINSKSSFRIMSMLGNEPAKPDPKLFKELEETISINLKLRVDRSNPDYEFWVYTRREGDRYFGVRLTRHKSYEKTLQPGELRPELATLLCLLSNPQPEDKFLDPFAGSGSIPLARSQFPNQQILAGDINPQIVDQLRKKVNKLKRRIILGRWDAANLRTFQDQSIDKIVTDPPWGIGSYQHLNLEKLYSQMLKEFIRVLKPQGRAVILTGQKELFETLLNQFSGFRLETEINTLVNGQKAGVYQIIKL